MKKISSKGRYALYAMIDIAEHHIGEWVTVGGIAERQGIPVKYLEQIVISLTRSGLLQSRRGLQGGYMLKKSPEQYTVGEILRAIEGKLAPVACLADDINQCKRKDICKTLPLWHELYDTINNYFDSITLKDLSYSVRFSVDFTGG